MPKIERGGSSVQKKTPESGHEVMRAMTQGVVPRWSTRENSSGPEVSCPKTKCILAEPGSAPKDPMEGDSRSPEALKGVPF